MSARSPIRTPATASGSDLATTLVVEAAAGTGKTTELVSRMVAALAAGAREAREPGGAHVHGSGGAAS